MADIAVLCLRMRRLFQCARLVNAHHARLAVVSPSGNAMASTTTSSMGTAMTTAGATTSTVATPAPARYSVSVLAGKLRGILLTPKP